MQDWMSSVSRAMISPELGIFVESKVSRVMYPNPLKSNSESMLDYRMAGKLLAIAVKNNFQVNINFAPVLFKLITKSNLFVEDIECVEPDTYTFL